MHGFLENFLILLIASAVAVPIFNRLRLGPVLAYLVAGVIAGPHVLGVIGTSDAEEGIEIGELGVVMLLFLIGLELSVGRLWLMRRSVFVVGALQVAVTVALLGALLLLNGEAWQAALVAAVALAMSSTAIGVQLMAERKELAQSQGRAALAILLLQDLVAIPAIALIPMLGGAAMDQAAGHSGAGLGLIKVIAAISAVVLIGRFLVRPVFRYVATTNSVEAFTGTTLLVVFGTAYVTGLAGISMAMGAFLAGLMLSESEFRHEIEANLEPFKGLLLGLFFLAVGMTVDWSVVVGSAVSVAVAVIALIVIKGAVLYVLGRTVARLERDDALKLAALLCQGGEFAFVLLALAGDAGLLPGSLPDRLTAVVVISMALTPLLLLGLDRWLAHAAKVPQGRPYDEIPAGERSRVIIAGFGRMGQIVARILRAQHVSFTALEHSVEQVDMSRRFGSTIYYGDPTRPELLRSAGAEHAELFVLATDDPEANIRTARLVKRLYPHLKVYARARNRQHAFRLMDLQVHSVVRETFHSSLEMAGQVLEGLGLDPAEARSRVARFREHDEGMLETQYQFYDDETKLVQNSQEALVELEQLFESDRIEQAAKPIAES